MKTIAIIPARYDSTRFPGKPLAMIKGKPMIQWVHERTVPHVDKVLVATDDRSIADVVKGFGGEVCIVNDIGISSGTERVHIAYTCFFIDRDYDLIINVQGDEPLIQKEHFDELKYLFSVPGKDQYIYTLACHAKKEDWPYVSVVSNRKDEAMYFSRAFIPPQKNWSYKHIGIYAYTPLMLSKIFYLPNTPLSDIESLEQLTWLECGCKIKVGIVNNDTIPVDHPRDIEQVERKL